MPQTGEPMQAAQEAFSDGGPIRWLSCPQHSAALPAA